MSCRCPTAAGVLSRRGRARRLGHPSILGYREYGGETYRSVGDKLKVTGPIRASLKLDLDDHPDPSTVRKGKDALTMAVCRALLQPTTTVLKLGSVGAIDSTGFDRVTASRRCARRTNHRFLAMTTTMLIYGHSGAILDIHCTTSRPLYTLIGWQVVKWNLDGLTVLTVDIRYDWADLRSLFREHSVRPVTKHRIFDNLDKEHNARIDDDVSYQRSTVESVIRALKRQCVDRWTSGTWYGLFRELAIKATLENVDTGIGTSDC